MDRGRLLTTSRVAVLLLALASPCTGAEPDATLRLITLDPGHFHAALIQKEMLPGVSPQVHVYAPLGPDLVSHLSRVARFNSRVENPTSWQLEVHGGPEFLARMIEERRGDVVIISGRNREKIERIRACVRAGLHVLADKPWVIDSAKLPLLEETLEAAREKGVVACDAMTQRYEITCILQRELVGEKGIFGSPEKGSPDDPGVRMESLHYILKMVAGAPNLRPPWFFDVDEQGEGLTDVGTHLVDLVQWILFPGEALDARRDVELQAASRWPTPLQLEEFRRVTGETEFPEAIRGRVAGGILEYHANTRVNYTLRGIHALLDIRWDFEAPAGAGDTELAVFRGSKSRVEVRQGKEESYRPEVYVVPNRPAEKDEILGALRGKIDSLQASYSGLAVEDLGVRLRVTVPDRLRVGHEAHFALLAKEFFGYVRDPKTLPAWEKSTMLAKYFVTTKGVELARKAPEKR